MNRWWPSNGFLSKQYRTDLFVLVINLCLFIIHYYIVVVIVAPVQSFCSVGSFEVHQKNTVVSKPGDCSEMALLSGVNVLSLKHYLAELPTVLILVGPGSALGAS